MKVTLYGAAGSVTGSAYFVKSKFANVLVDLGIFQGEKSLESMNHSLPPIDISTLNSVIITHAHLDHTGRLPLLAKYGYKGPVYATAATISIISVILNDSAHIQANDLERRNKKRALAGEKPHEADFTVADVAAVIKLLVAIPYNESFEVAPFVFARVREAGHLLGSVSIELTVREDSKKKTILFSGDLGRQDSAILNDPDPFHHADLVILESTYGDRDHKPLSETLKEAHDIFLRAIETNGKILVPSFAVGRAQQLLYYIARAIHRGNLPEVPVYLDSPMAIEATGIYVSHPELFDDETKELFRDGAINGDFSRMKISVTADESRALNNVSGP